MELLPDGRIRIDDLDDPITLRRPKYGPYKRLRLQASEMGEESMRLSKEADDLDEGSDERRAALRASEDKAEQMVVGWWRSTVAELAEAGSLPESVDDWPTELIVGQRAISGVLEHWRTVPLDRGAMGQPIPGQT